MARRRTHVIVWRLATCRIRTWHSVKPEHSAETLNKQGETLFAQADGAVTTANKYFATLRAE